MVTYKRINFLFFLTVLILCIVGCTPEAQSNRIIVTPDWGQSNTRLTESEEAQLIIPPPEQLPPEPTTSIPAAPEVGDRLGISRTNPLTLFISLANYDMRRAPSGYSPDHIQPLAVYGWATDRAMGLGSPKNQRNAHILRELNGLLALPNHLPTMLVISSYQSLEDAYLDPQILSVMQQLDQREGQFFIGYNSERSVGTPDDEFNKLISSDPNINSVARLGRLTAPHGHCVFWGPIRATSERISSHPDDNVVKMLSENNVCGIAYQEQQRVDREEIKAHLARDGIIMTQEILLNETQARVEQVIYDVERMKAAAGDDFHVSVQLMSTRCDDNRDGETQNWERCADFFQKISGIIDSWAVWSSSERDRLYLMPFVQKLRHTESVP